VKLPAPVQSYFDADRDSDRDMLLGVFAQDATVTDEGKTHQGRPAIAGWWRDTKARYEPVAEPLDAVVTGRTVTVHARVSGTFPGSPVTLAYAFRLEGKAIAELEIGA